MLDNLIDTLNNLSACDVIIKIMAFLLALGVHESSHAVVINRLSNDPMACRDRMTLNPMAHIDPLGTIVVPIMSIFFTKLPLIGWAKPVVWDTASCSTKRFKLKTSDALTSAAGPLSNIMLSIVALVTAVLCTMAIAPDLDSRIDLCNIIFTWKLENLVYPGASIEKMILLKFSVALIQVNVGLAVFNLLPIGPLDGAGILCWIIPDHLYERYNVFRNNPIWSIVLMGLVSCDPLYNFLTGIILTPISDMLVCITKFMLGI